ncbi:MAG: transposase [Gemmataceae bacterium]
MVRQPSQHFTLLPVASQQIHVAFDGGRIVSDAGLLAVRALEKPLRVIAGLAQRLPDPRSPKDIEHGESAMRAVSPRQQLTPSPLRHGAQSGLAANGPLPERATAK